MSYISAMPRAGKQHIVG